MRVPAPGQPSTHCPRAPPPHTSARAIPARPHRHRGPNQVRRLGALTLSTLLLGEARGGSGLMQDLVPSTASPSYSEVRLVVRSVPGPPRPSPHGSREKGPVPPHQRVAAGLEEL